MRAKFALLTAAVLLLALVLTLHAQEAPPPADPNPAGAATPGPASGAAGSEVTLELKRNQRALIRLAFPAFRGIQGLAAAEATAAREIEATVRQDLIFSGYFQIQGPSDFGALHLTGEPQRDLDQYRSLGNDVLLSGDVRHEEDRIVFEGRLFDLKGGQSILAKRYRGGDTVARRIGHTFADEVIRYLTGGKGIGLSSIAFSSTRTGFKEIFLMDYDGLNQRRITGHRSTSMSPAWSPSGDSIAYTSFVNGPPGLYLVQLADGKKRPLVTSASLNISPSFSPDGSRIVFSRSLEGNVEIYTANKDGSDLRRLTHNDAIDTNPAWSPKGGVIAFTSSRGGSPHIYLMDAEGTNVRRLTFEGTYNDGAAWSPDGDLIAYASRREGRFQIAVTNIATQETRVLTSGPGEHQSPTFSPDGRKIAFTSSRNGTRQIFVMDLDGGNARQLTYEGDNDMADWSRGQQ
jgi:TolB protein